VVVDQLSDDCAAISGMLKNLQVLEAASEAAVAAETSRSSSRKVSLTLPDATLVPTGKRLVTASGRTHHSSSSSTAVSRALARMHHKQRVASSTCHQCFADTW
jgi:hypothetical protein